MFAGGAQHAAPAAPRGLRGVAGGARRRVPALSLSGPAAGAIGVTVVFIALSFWWLWQDSAMPYSDAVTHLRTAYRFQEQLSEGDWLGPFQVRSIYAPLTPFVGSLGVLVGGRTVAAPIVAENLVYVPLLAVSCYCVGARVLGSPAAGLLAVVFALGSPLIIEQFHVFMLDAPLAALVAATVWLVLASERFRRVDVSLAAGMVAGLGMLSKQSFPLYVGGFVVVVLLRGGGWRNWRGLAAFVVVTVVVAGPWYGYNANRLHSFLAASSGTATVPLLAKPPLWSSANFEWYFWAFANGLLFVPLLGFALIGLVDAAVAVVRRPSQSGALPEVLCGGLSAWLALTLMTHHDVRYSEPLIVYLAVLGTGWIVRLRGRRWRSVAVAGLGLAVVATTLGATFGVGGSGGGSPVLPGNRLAPHGEGVPVLNHLTVYSNHDFMVSGPHDGGDILRLLREIRRDGIRQVVWFSQWAPLQYTDFNNHGLILFTELAGLSVPYGSIDLGRVGPRVAVLIPERKLGRAPPCARMSDGRGLWIRLGNPWVRGARDYCPRFGPAYYGP